MKVYTETVRSDCLFFVKRPLLAPPTPRGVSLKNGGILKTVHLPIHKVWRKVYKWREQNSLTSFFLIKTTIVLKSY